MIMTETSKNTELQIIHHENSVIFFFKYTSEVM